MGIDPPERPFIGRAGSPFAQISSSFVIHNDKDLNRVAMEHIVDKHEVPPDERPLVKVNIREYFNGLHTALVGDLLITTWDGRAPEATLRMDRVP